MRKNYEKLIRDGIPNILREKKLAFEVYQAQQGPEFLAFLRRKLSEEICEFLEAKTDKSRSEELADVIEVVQALEEYYPETRRFLIEKRRERGGFLGKIILKWVDEK